MNVCDIYDEVRCSAEIVRAHHLMALLVLGRRENQLDKMAEIESYVYPNLLVPDPVSTCETSSQ